MPIFSNKLNISGFNKGFTHVGRYFLKKTSIFSFYVFTIATVNASMVQVTYNIDPLYPKIKINVFFKFSTCNPSP